MKTCVYPSSTTCRDLLWEFYHFLAAAYLYVCYFDYAEQTFVFVQQQQQQRSRSVRQNQAYVVYIPFLMLINAGHNNSLLELSWLKYIYNIYVIFQQLIKMFLIVLLNDNTDIQALLVYCFQHTMIWDTLIITLHTIYDG